MARETPVTISSSVFSNRANATLYVPVGSKTKYQSANYWKEFKEIKEIICFADDNVKTICLANWDTNSDGELSKEESAAVTDLGDAFKSNTTITSFNELEYFTGLTSIPDNAFKDCTNLTAIKIPCNVGSIGSYAFWTCTSLESIAIPASVTSIATGAFNFCNGMNRVEFASIERLCSINFADYDSNPLLYGDHLYIAGNEVTDLVIPVGVTSIGQYAFLGWDGLLSATIPEGVTSIGYRAFQYCANLRRINIPSSVSSIGDLAFEYCNNLYSIRIDKTTPLSITDNVFTNPYASLYVPYGRKAAYQAASYWKDFKDIIEFIEGDVNSDYETDVVDVVDIARFVVGTPAETFVEILADINRDGGVNIGDAVALVNEIAGDQNFVKELHTSRRSATSANEDMLTLEETDNGIALVLMNQRDYTAFQFDLYVPEETDVAQMLLNSQRKQKHQLLYNKVEEGHYRVVALSTSNRTFMGNSGELLSFALNSVSDGDIAVRNILFYDVEGDGYTFDDLLYGGTATEIADTQSAIPTDGKYYTIDGRLIGEKPTTKGIYIVNGKKIMLK